MSDELIGLDFIPDGDTELLGVNPSPEIGSDLIGQDFIPDPSNDPNDDDWFITRAGKSLLRGAGRAPGAIADLVTYPVRDIWDGGPIMSAPLTKFAPKTQAMVEPITGPSSEDPNITERAFEFVGENLVPLSAATRVGKVKDLKPGVEKLAKYFSTAPKTQLMTSGLAGAGSATGEKVYPNSSAAPLVGALLGGSTYPVASKSVRGLWSGLKSHFDPEETIKEAARVFQDVIVDNNPEFKESLAKALADSVDDPIGYKSIPELTGDANAASLLTELGADQRFKQKYLSYSKDRAKARDRLLENLSEAPSKTNAAEGEFFRDFAEEAKKSSKTKASALYKTVDPEGSSRVSVKDISVELAAEVEDRFRKGKAPNSRVQDLVDDLVNGGEQRTWKELHQIKSEAGDLAVDLAESDKGSTAVANMIVDRVKRSLDDAADIKTGGTFSPKQAATYTEATKAYSRHSDRFLQGRTSKVLAKDGKHYKLDDEKVMKQYLDGTKRGAENLQAVIDGSDEMAEFAKRSFLDRIPRDRSDNLTRAKSKAYLEQQEEALKVLFPDPEHRTAFRKGLEDAISEGDVDSLAHHASKGQSGTKDKFRFGEMYRKALSGRFAFRYPWQTNMAKQIFRNFSSLSDDKVEELVLEALLDKDLAKKLTDLTLNKTKKDGAAIFDDLMNLGRETGIITAIEGTRGEGEDEPSEGSSSLLDALVPKAEAEERKPAELSIKYKVNKDEDTPQPKAKQTSAVSSDLINAVIGVESGGKAKATSPVGAKGLMQLMDTTGKAIHKEMGLKGKYDPFDEKQNKKIGTYYLRKLMDRFDGDVGLALAAYNAGPTRISKLLKSTGGEDFDDIKSKLPDETRKYVPKVLKALYS